jgi:hypothetical protein
MAEQLLATGVELRLPSRQPDEPEDPPAVDPKTGEVFVETQVFAELDDDGRRFRIGGTIHGGTSVSPAADPTSTLLRIAKEARSHLGDLLGDLRIGGCDVTRFEFHATPHRIELASDLRDRLATSWHERPPR